MNPTLVWVCEQCGHLRRLDRDYCEECAGFKTYKPCALIPLDAADPYA